MRHVIVLCCMLALAGCSNPLIRDGATRDRINAELAEAGQARPKPAQPEAVSQALLPPLVVEMPRSTGAVEPRFDLVVNGAPAGQVFNAMVSGTRYSMLAHPDVKEPISINLKDVTVREALDALRELFGYEYRFDGNRIFVQPIGLQTRVFQVNYLVGRRQGRADVRVTSGSIQTPSFSAPGVTGGPATAPVPTATGAGGSSAQSVESSRITTTTDSDFWRDITAALNAIVGIAAPADPAVQQPGAQPAAGQPGAPAQPAGQGSPGAAGGANRDGRAVVVNPQAGIVVVRGYPADMRNVEAFLKAMSLVVDRQVMLEAKIIEVSLSDGYQAGINWGAFKTGNNSRVAVGQVGPGGVVRTDGNLVIPTGRLPDGSVLSGSSLGIDPARSSPTLPDPLGGAAAGSATSVLGLGANAAGSVFGLALQTSSFAALLSFLETQGTVHVLSSPRIATMNNQKAVLKVGTDEFFVTNVTTTTTSSGSSSTVSPTITVQPFFSGIALDVTPQISESNLITLHIHPSVSAVSDKTKTLNLGSLGTFTLPLASSNINESDTIVRVQDGSIVAIGGLMRQAQNETRSQVPGLGDVPAIGNLFRNRNQSMQKSELVILLKTTVIHGDSTWQGQAQEVNERVQAMQRPAQPQAR